jgi:hypothetical protein
MLKIDKGVPQIPNGKYHKIAQEMEDGDSVLLTKKEAGALRQAIYKYCPGYRARWRICKEELKLDQHMYRVWKVKKL